ncbi:hypothetical protein TIFTF001_056616, partial [Ficus carica]
MILTKIFRHFGLSQEDETDTVPITAITELNNLKMMGLVLEEDIADVEANFVAPDDHEAGLSTDEDISLRSIYQQVMG